MRQGATVQEPCPSGLGSAKPATRKELIGCRGPSRDTVAVRAGGRSGDRVAGVGFRWQENGTTLAGVQR